MKDEELKMVLNTMAGESALSAEATTVAAHALEQPKPEPVVRIVGRAPDEPVLGWSQHWSDFPIGTEFYTSPPKRDPLTDEEIDALYKKSFSTYQGFDIKIVQRFDLRKFVRAIEAAHGIKGEA